ncbi:MAG: acyl-CoA thioesterase [Bacteroidales bacterium]|nr:acyl-CoA thioesterase [Bacteroidales bacterium]
MELISTKICKTSDIGVNDNLFGGALLSWMDEAGGTFAATKCCTPNMITLKIDEVLFKKPVKVKQHIKIYGKILGVGKSSIKIFVEARTVDFKNKGEIPVCSTEILFVRISDNGAAMPIDENVRVNIVKSL